jgi:predicted nucleic acid-binding protein
MLAIDTNIVVRLLTGDDLDQASRARALVEAQEVFVATTVLLETEWVLRGAYGLGKAEVISALRAFAGLPNVILEDTARASTALGWAAGGLDFGDALHLASAEHCEGFATFDRRLAKAASDVAQRSVREP